MLLAKALMNVALIVAGLFAGVLLTRLVGQFVPQLIAYNPDEPLYLGYPLIPFWSFAMPVASILAALLLARGRGGLIVASAIIGSFGTVKAISCTTQPIVRNTAARACGSMWMAVSIYEQAAAAPL
eukprot:scaffold164407_cov30-Tisochrysis_lutea.AAC.2